MNPFQTAGGAQGHLLEHQPLNTSDSPVPLHIHSSEGGGTDYFAPVAQGPAPRDLYARPSSRNERASQQSNFFSFDGQGPQPEIAAEGSSLQSCIADRPDPYRQLREQLAQKNQDLKGVMAS